jgi:hypothetical protein
MTNLATYKFSRLQKTAPSAAEIVTPGCRNISPSCRQSSAQLEKQLPQQEKTATAAEKQSPSFPAAEKKKKLGTYIYCRNRYST